MQLIIPAVTPLDFSRQVKYSCVISLSAAATSGVLNKVAAPITITFLVHGRFGIIVTLDTLISDLHTRHRPFVIEIVVSRWAVRFLYFSTRDRTSATGSVALRVANSAETVPVAGVVASSAAMTARVSESASGCSRQPADAWVIKQFCLLPRRTAAAPAPLRWPPCAKPA